MKQIFYCIVTAFAAAVITSNSLSAQTRETSGARYTVSGAVRDSISDEGEPMATVIVQSSSEETYGNTDTEGRFTISVPETGKYTIRIVSMGRKEVIRNFEISEDVRHVDLGIIRMQDDRQQLSEAVVSKQVPFVKTEVDKLSYQISEDPDAKTSNVLDMLRKVPRVTVDGEDNILVNGQSNFKIYVNGRPSNMFSNKPGQILKSMPAESIKKVEVISDPGSKFDAEGVGGILNIVMNTKRADGYNVSVNAGGGNKGGNAGAYAAAKIGKLSVSANYGFNYYMLDNSTNVSEREVFGQDGQMLQRNESDFSMDSRMPMHYGSLEMSYDIDSLNLVTLSGNLFLMNMNSTSDMTYNMYGPAGAPVYDYLQNSRFNMKNGSGSINANWQHSFRKRPGEMLTLSYMYSNTPNGQHSYMDVAQFNGDRSEAMTLHNHIRNISDASSQEHTAQIDYVIPFAGKHRFETGAKYIGRFNNSDGVNEYRESPEETWREDPLSPSQKYRHTQNIFAIYADYTVTLGQFGIKAGARAEETLQKISYIKPENSYVNADFTDIVPNISLSWSPSMMQTLQLTYNMRISRPGIYYLNPFRQTINSSEITYGNPDLVSEKNHTAALNYSVFQMKFGVNCSLRYSFTNNSISSYQFVDEEGVLNNTYGNVGKNSSIGTSVYAYWNPTTDTRIFLNGDIRYASYKGNPSYEYLEGLSSSGWAGNCFLGIQQSFKYGFRLSANGGYFSSGVNLQGKGPSSYFYSLSLNKSFLDGKLNLSLNATNFIDPRRHYITTVNTEYLKSRTDSSNDSSYLVFSISYSFGNLKQIVKKVARGIVNDDLMKSSGNSTGAGAGAGTGTGMGQ